MYLYLLKRLDHGPRPGYDVTNGVVVAADTPAEARQFAAQEHGDEGKAVWLDAKAVTLRRIGVTRGTVKRGVVLRDAVNG